MKKQYKDNLPMTIIMNTPNTEDVLAFVGNFYKHSKTYQVGLNALKNMYQRYSKIFYTDDEFANIMDELGFKLNKNNCYKLRENKKMIWGKGGLIRDI